MSKASVVHDRVVELQEILRTEKDFSVPWGYFHDELAIRADFIGLGEAGTNEIIDGTIEHIAASRGWSRSPGWEPTTHIKELGFWHGFRTLGLATGIFFYYDHSCQGLLGVMTDLSGPPDLFRLSSVAEPG